MKKKIRKTRVTKNMMYQDTMNVVQDVTDLVYYFSNFQDSLKRYPKNSVLLAAQISKEWSKSLAAGKSSNKFFVGKNKNKYTKLVKLITEFMES